jgi:hypothetical protein
MYTANERVIAHNNNIGLINIRNAEVSYFSNVYSTFGLNAVMLAGFVLSSISQVPGMEASCSIFWKYMYWTTTAVCIVVALHIVLDSIFLVVYGQGMAMRGPVGSMVQAVQGFEAEQNQTVRSFVLTVVLFTISTAATYWIMMDSLPALLSCVITLIGVCFWYHYCLRIYNRFYWDKEEETKWRSIHGGGEGESSRRRAESHDDQPDFVVAFSAAQEEKRCLKTTTSRPR